MNRSPVSRIFCQSVFSIAAVAVLVAPASAQQAPLRSLRFYVVKPDRVADFQAAIKDYNAIVKKARSTRYYTVWHSLTGANEYLRADNYANWAELDTGTDPKLKDQEGALAALTLRIVQCTESSRRAIEEVIPELSLPSPPEMPKMIRVLQSKVRPDKTAEYLELYKNEVFPAIKKSGLKFFSLSVARYGGTATTYVSVSGVNSWSELDGGIGAEKGMGKEGYQKFLTRIRPLLIDAEYNMFSFMPTLSYLPTTSAGN